MARLGIYGGSFNPPHVGHTLAAREMVEKLALDRLFVIPAASPPHKRLPEGSPSPYERLEVTRRAFSTVPRAEVSDIELRREGTSYTVDTIAEFKALYPQDEIFLIMGTDMLLSFRTWYCPERIAAGAVLAVMHREEDEALWQKVEAEAEALRRDMGARIVLTNNRCIRISSTSVRRLLALQAPGFLEPEAQRLILTNGWYQCRADLRGLPYDELETMSLSLHDEKRRPHALGVAGTAAELAMEYGEDEDVARRAGILHDVTKALGEEEQRHLCAYYGLELTDSERENTKLLHAVTGAAVAERVFGECPEAVLAIRWHTTGRPAMTTLEKILYLADYVEPNRDFPGVERLRTLTRADLDAAVWLGLETTYRYLVATGRSIDPVSREARRYYTAAAAEIDYKERSEDA